MIISARHPMGQGFRIRLLLSILGATGVAGGCGSPPAPEPTSAPAQTLPLPPPTAEAPPPSEPSPTPDAGAAAPVEDAPLIAPSAPAPAPEPAEPKRSQSPVNLVTARDAAFLVDYANSDAKKKAHAACETESKGEADKQGACLTKARDKFMPDVLRFRKDSETKTSLVVYKRTGSTLRELWTGNVELSEPSPSSLKVKLVGSGKGTRPLWLGKSEVVIDVPNEYSLEFDDPTLGHLRYDAKIGLITQ
ncbi:MAG TPA: hypothetical protein VFZ53_04740 [Polyangiaceae bacterium]